MCASMPAYLPPQAPEQAGYHMIENGKSTSEVKFQLWSHIDVHTWLHILQSTNKDIKGLPIVTTLLKIRQLLLNSGHYYLHYV